MRCIGSKTSRTTNEMKANRFLGLLGFSLCLWSSLAKADAFSFGAVSHAVRGIQDAGSLREALTDSDADNLAFMVVNGIKSANESCSDELYQRRKALLDSAKNGIILSLAGSDWTMCKHGNGRSAAIGRLQRMRELFFTDEFSLGGTRLPLIRQSGSAKFRNYGENARWEVGSVLFATINLPENNNHFLADAGRNSEFEDRVIANREWLHRVFTYASLRKMDAIVLFSSGNPFAPVNRGKSRQDGFADIRKQILDRGSRFQGKTLFIHGYAGAPRKSSPQIRWRGDIGVLEAGTAWTKVEVDPASSSVFAVSSSPDKKQTINDGR